MKKLFIFALALSLACTYQAQAQDNPQEKTDLEKLNIKGSVASVTETSGNDKTVYNFNKDGMLTNISINKGKSVSGTIKFTYNDKGQLEKREINFQRGLWFTLYAYPFNKEYAFNEGSVGSETFKYDATGRLIERNEAIKWSGATNNYKETYKYNAKGELVNTKSSGDMADNNYVYDVSGNMIKRFVGDIDDYPTTEYKYNSKNQLISIQESGEPPMAVEYNDMGDCIKKSGKDFDDVSFTYTYTYTYDTQKNWTKQVSVYSDGYSKSTTTTNRIIVYNQ